MKMNEGTVDRTVRVTSGLLLIGLTAMGLIGVWGYIGIVPLLTGAVGICPIYSFLDMNSCPAKKGHL